MVLLPQLSLKEIGEIRLHLSLLSKLKLLKVIQIKEVVKAIYSPMGDRWLLKPINRVQLCIIDIQLFEFSMERHKQGGEWEGFQHFHDHSQVVSTQLPQINKARQLNVEHPHKTSSKQSPLKRPNVLFKPNKKPLKLQSPVFVSQASITQQVNNKQKMFENEKKTEQRQQRQDQVKKVQLKRLQRIPILRRDEDYRFSGKVIYKGFVPKTSDNFMKLLKEVDWETKTQKKRDIRNLNGVQFNSQFQGGNLNLAMVSELQYDLYMRVDTNTQGHRQWFYFCMKNQKKCSVKLHIYRFKKQFSLFQRGMKPYVRSRKEGDQWKQGGQNVYYHYERSRTQYGVVKPAKTFILSFTYRFEHPGDEVFIAAGIPYTYTFLNKQISMYKQIVNKRQNLNFQSSTLCKSVCGLQLPLLIIHHSLSKLIHTNTSKKIIIINARTHPGEASCSWALDGILKELSLSEQIQEWMLKENIWLKIVPMLNPDGVVMGNYRTGIIGQDFNRFFKIGRQQFYPQIAGLKKLVSKSKKQGEIVLFLDLHGHSILKNSFIYGPSQSQCSNFKMRNFPYYLFQKSKYFRLSSCKFQKEFSKNQTARLYFQNQQKILSFTCQNSLGLYYNQLQTFQMLIADWHEFGKAILHSMKDSLVNKETNVYSKDMIVQLAQKPCQKQHKNDKKFMEKKINTNSKSKAERITTKLPKTPPSDSRQMRQFENLNPITPFSSTQINRQDDIVDIHRCQNQQHSGKIDFRVRRKSEVVKNSANIKNNISSKNANLPRSNSQEEEAASLTFGRSLTSKQAQNLKKEIQQAESVGEQKDENYLSYQLEQIAQNFSDQYLSINDSDSSSDGLPQIEKNYILQYIKQNQRQNSQERIPYHYQSSKNTRELKQPKISRFRQIRFRSIEEMYSQQNQQKEVLKNQIKKLKMEPHKFKDNATKSLINKYNDIYSNTEFDDPTMVSITQQKKLNQRTGYYRRAQKDPFVLIQRKDKKTSLREPQSGQ